MNTQHKITVDYIAGFTDGEGWIGRVGRGCRITWGQNTREVLDAIADWARGLGANPRIYKVPAKPPRRPNGAFVLTVTHRKYVERILTALLPRLIVKTNDAQSLLQWMQSHPKYANCEPVDHQQLLTLHSEGYTQTEIAKRMGYGTNRIGKECRLLGLRFLSGGKVANGKRTPKRTREEHLAARAAKERKPCPECGTLIYLASERCRPCAGKHRPKRKS